MKTILPLLFVLWSSISFSQINLKNLQGQTVAFFDELKKYPSDAPVLVFTWANEYCPPCEKILDALKTDYATLNNDYGLRIMTINVDHGDGFIEHYNDVHKSSLGNYTTTYGFVRKYKDKKGWNFDHYADDNESFITAIEATGTPTAFIFLNDQVEFRLDGFTVPEHKKGANLNDPEIIKATKQTYMDVISSFYAYERYFSQKWMYSTKEDATYRRSIVKVGDMYEITDSWVSGEIQMRGMSTDILAINKVGSYKFYHKNGKIETEITYVNGKKTA